MKNSKFDYNLVTLLLLLFITSCIAIHTAQEFGQYEGDFLFRQVTWYFIGFGMILGVMYLDSEQIFRLNWFFYSLSLFLLIALILSPESIAREINGAKSWFQIPGIGSLQPAEFTKISLIICLSYLIQKHHNKYEDKTLKTDFFLLIKMGAATLLPILLIMKQPDLGTSLVLMCIFIGILFVSGISWRIIGGIFIIGGSIVSGILYLVFLHPEILRLMGIKIFQLGRIYAWIDPESYKSGEGFNLIKALLAIGSGGVSGYKGSGVYVPEAHTDFIFSVIASKYGFLGSSILITIYFFLISGMVKLALDVKNSFESYLCVGVVSMIFFHIFENIGMNIGLLPITGIPLPFISYGGSSLMGNMLAIGLIFSISYRKRAFMFG
ncbi:rod shape determining protein RodA [Peribacillus simplex]|uniref:FtsW/RodA/SpoVE family cell cycle protein n=1 Tax=Peribacillus TaxID=2675229 RepID=UPI000B68B43E|nr:MULTISPECIES: FtsW/RodA/SpoVE family cell cycle protein [Peribacillus]MDF9758303.1 rod shape determining protein RodA [Peribacillus simplex]MDV7766620.1 rod shape-determining protein RodA [Peribacillus sp. CSMR9]MDW7614329.1 FtsW/RodA/SpoVE family cell cycle protein [Peribacillus simplex]SNT48038.1 rod shape determining protein RodA [Bacillus sp. OK838]